MSGIVDGWAADHYLGKMTDVIAPVPTAPGGRPDACFEASVSDRGTQNLLLKRMTSSDFDLLRPNLEAVSLEIGTTLARAGQPIDTICFLDGGLAGFLDVLPDGQRLAIGVIGREGVVGWPAVMGNDRWPYDVEVRAKDCNAQRLPFGGLMASVERSPTLRDLLLKFAGTFTAQMGRTIVSNLIHPVERRTARWILLYHDRVDGDEIAMTHEELGNMLGVRRASITTALHILEGEGAIKGYRGRLVVRNRAILEQMAGDTYGFAEAEYNRLIG
jgi:CRP-like cAMP-binding protein